MRHFFYIKTFKKVFDWWVFVIVKFCTLFRNTTSATFQIIQLVLFRKKTSFIANHCHLTRCVSNVGTGAACKEPVITSNDLKTQVCQLLVACLHWEFSEHSMIIFAWWKDICFSFPHLHLVPRSKANSSIINSHRRLLWKASWTWDVELLDLTNKESIWC